MGFAATHVALMASQAPHDPLSLHCICRSLGSRSRLSRPEPQATSSSCVTLDLSLHPPGLFLHLQNEDNGGTYT